MKNSVILFVGMMFIGVACADALPDTLLYKGKPVDPLCLVEITHEKQVVDLDKCGLASEPGRTIVGENKQLIAQDYIGYNYDIKINNTVSLHAYSYYKSFGMVGSAAIVRTLFHGGGTGDVSSLSLVEREGHKMKISVLNIGDRCNYGLVDMQRERAAREDNLIYSLKLTSYDLLMLAHANQHDLKAYNDLANCAICCKATAVFKRHIGKDFRREKLLYVDLAAFPQDTTASASSQTHQACFDALFQAQLKTGQTKLNLQQLAGFMEQFNRQCLTNKARI